MIRLLLRRERIFAGVQKQTLLIIRPSFQMAIITVFKSEKMYAISLWNKPEGKWLNLYSLPSMYISLPALGILLLLDLVLSLEVLLSFFFFFRLAVGAKVLHFSLNSFTVWARLWFGVALKMYCLSCWLHQNQS